MRLIPHDPFGGVASLQGQMNRLFDTFHDDDWPMPMGRGWPSLDVIETPETVQVKAELPGMAPEDIEISMAGHLLTIKGEKFTEKEDEGKTWHRKERTQGKFLRTIAVPSDVDEGAIEATHHAGVLTVVLPKREAVKPKRVKVRAK